MELKYSEYLQDPTRERYVHLHGLLIAQGIDRDALPRLIELIRSEQFDAATRLQDSSGQDWMLSPSFHYWSAHLAELTADDEGLELERFEFQACLAGLLATGDGSANSPFLATYTTDITDVLVALGKEPVAQHLVQRQSGCFDLVGCSDGSELFFARPEIDKARKVASGSRVTAV